MIASETHEFATSYHAQAANWIVEVETELYLPVKRFLEDLGFSVKGEVCGADLVGLSEGEPPVVVVGELKQSFNLELILQGVDRASSSDEIWLAARVSARGKGRESDKRYRNLCRRLGFGLLGVSDRGTVDILVPADAPLPRRDTKRRSRLVREHRRRIGDPTLGGSTRLPIMTAYRQQALACVSALEHGPLRVRDVTKSVPDAPKILQSNFHGWFERVTRGVYQLTAAGREALLLWPQT